MVKFHLVFILYPIISPIIFAKQTTNTDNSETGRKKINYPKYVFIYSLIMAQSIFAV